VGATTELRLFLVNAFFSKSGLIVSKTRAALSPADVNKLVLKYLVGPVMTVTSKPAFEIAFEY